MSRRSGVGPAPGVLVRRRGSHWAPNDHADTLQHPAGMDSHTLKKVLAGGSVAAATTVFDVSFVALNMVPCKTSQLGPVDALEDISRISFACSPKAFNCVCMNSVCIRTMSSKSFA